MTIIITGAAGFIGSSLCSLFHERDVAFLAIDNFSYGYRENISKEWRFLEMDIGDSAIEKYIEKDDIIIHLAYVSSLAENQASPIPCYQTNHQGTLNLLEIARKKGVRHFLFASSSAVYEKSTHSPFCETDTIETPNLLYSLAKYQGEQICHSYRENYGLNITILRFFNMYGPKNDYHRKLPPLIPYIIRELANGQSPILHSNGLQSRDYLYIDDLLELIISILDNPIAFGQIYNASTNRVYSVHEIFETIRECLVKKGKTVDNIEPIYRSSEHFWDKYPQLKTGECPFKDEHMVKEVNKYTRGSFEKAWKELGWFPQTTMKEGLERVMEYYLHISEGNVLK
jgi:nucleoside-diphosphate-sugar epimerase